MACHGSHRDKVVAGKYFESYAAEELNGCCSLAKGTDGDERGHGDLARKTVVNHETVVVHDEYKDGHGYAGSPEDITGNDSPDGVLIVWEDIGDYGSRAGCDNVGNDGEKP